jgi:hypothetical protein
MVNISIFYIIIISFLLALVTSTNQAVHVATKFSSSRTRGNNVFSRGCRLNCVFEFFPLLRLVQWTYRKYHIMPSSLESI